MTKPTTRADGVARATGPMAALRRPAFTLLLSIQLVNAVAVWVHVVAVQWVLTERGESATVVSLAPAAMALPFLVFALPMGVVVGYASRERLMTVATTASALAVLAAAALAASGTDSAAAVLATVVMVGVALVVVGVAWQSLLPEMLDRTLVPSAAVVDGAVYNLARALGPLLAGVGLGLQGSVVTFGATSALFLICAVALAAFQRRRPGRRAPWHPILPGLVAGLRFARHSPWTARLLLRMTMFGVPASALWALFSLVVHERFHLGSDGFGAMMALIGMGSVGATVLLSRLRQRLSITVFAAVLSVGFASTLMALGVLTAPLAVAPFLVLGGVAWVGVQSTWMMLAHQALPDWVRPRIIALLLFLFQGAQAVGSLLWGVVADLVGLQGALVAASAGMVLSVVLLVRSGLPSSAGIEPMLADPDATVAVLVSGAAEGELAVTYEYVVPPSRTAEFRAAMEHLRLSRLRLGARDWSLRPHPARAGEFVERYRVTDRHDLLEQETVRLTVPEQRLRMAVASVARVAGPEVFPTMPAPGRRQGGKS